MTNGSGSHAFSGVGRFHKVQGRCPACGRETLFLADGGYVTCSIIGCARPDAAHEAISAIREPIESERDALYAIINSHYFPSAVIPTTHCACGTEVEDSMPEHRADMLIAAGFRRQPTPQISAEQVLNEAADALEGRLGTDGAPTNLYEFRQWLRTRAAVVTVAGGE